MQLLWQRQDAAALPDAGMAAADSSPRDGHANAFEEEWRVMSVRCACASPHQQQLLMRPAAHMI